MSLQQLPSPPPPSSAAARAVMVGNRAANTRPEVALRSALHRLGVRFRKHARPVEDVRCRADIVFRAARVAVFVDGCFWHCCPQHGTSPRSNVSYWTAKLARNVERDRRNDAALRAAGWTSVRVWEHENAHEAALAIAALVRARLHEVSAAAPAGTGRVAPGPRPVPTGTGANRA